MLLYRNLSLNPDPEVDTILLRKRKLERVGNDQPCTVQVRVEVFTLVCIQNEGEARACARPLCSDYFRSTSAVIK
jgi:hypothetical protein